MDRPETYHIDNFVFPRTENNQTVSWLRNSKLLKPFPAFNKKVCIGCGECFRACPARAITMVDRRPQLDIDKCIRCFCCHEGCVPKAVEIKRNHFAGLIEAGLGFMSFLGSEFFHIRKK